MTFSKLKNIKRFKFGINRNFKSHKAGSNTVTIDTKSVDDSVATSISNITMTVKEAKALQSFLNTHLSDNVIS